MKKEVIEIKSILSFLIFLLCIAKIFLINWFEILPIYSSTNRAISWGILLPLILIGCIWSITIVKKYLSVSSNVGVYNLALVVPLLLYCLYLGVLLTGSIFR